MAIRLTELLNLPSLRQMKLLAGTDGLGRIVTWPYVCHTNSFADFVQGGELLLITGVGIRFDEEGLLSLLMLGNENHCAGVVFFTGEYIKEIPESVISLANQLNLPLFEISWGVRFADITKQISSYILNRQDDTGSLSEWAENLLNGDMDMLERCTRSADRYGYEEKLPHQVALLSAENFTQKHSVEGIRSENQEDFLFHLVQDYFQQYIKDMICVPHAHCVLLIYPVKSETKERLYDMLNEVGDMVLDQLSGICVRCGIGRIARNTCDLRKSLIDAEKALKTARFFPGSKLILRYRDMGVYRLFFEIDNRDELRDFYYDIMGPLVEYDRKNNTEFVKTLSVFLDNKLNHSKTSRLLYIHRNSLIYRISRIEEILGKKLEDPSVLIELQLCMLIDRFLSFS